MNQRDLTERLDALQNALSDLIEADPTDLDSIIQYYYLLRKFHVLEYYCKKEGYSNLGFHHIPATRVSEQNAKSAIEMGLVLKSLKQSAYATEQWTLRDTSSDLFMSPPRQCFKKGGFEVTVWFDDKEENAFPYINWSYIYYQDEDDNWHKTEGLVDYDGLYYVDQEGNKSYFLLFYEDSTRYGNTKMWSVHYKNEHIYLPSSSRRARATKDPAGADTSARTTESPPADRRSPPETTQGGAGPRQRVPTLRRRRGRGEGKPSKRQRVAGGGSAVPSPEDVGRSHRSVARTNLTRLERLQAEAGDPALILLRGPANTLKCWRYRWHSKFGNPTISSVFKWVTQTDNTQDGRMLLAFKSVTERQHFLDIAHFPKGTSWALGALDAL
ncbi:E2 protein [human papillomavirus 215]|nr:E2 protein [human papillomavirus 215]